MQNSAATTNRLPIRITYTESADSVIEALEQAPSVINKKQLILWILIITAIIVLLILKSSLYPDGIDWKKFAWNVVPVLLIAFFIFFFFLRQIYGRKSIEEAYRKGVGRDESKVVCEFGESAVFTSSEGGIASHYPWTVITRVVERPKGVLLYHAPNAFHWFPKSAFASEADYSCVIELAKSKVANYEIK
jgi:hypothetical protein